MIKSWNLRIEVLRQRILLRRLAMPPAEHKVGDPVTPAPELVEILGDESGRVEAADHLDLLDLTDVT